MNMMSNMFEKHAQVLQAMAHPKRLEIINLLRDRPLSVSQIQTMLALRQAYLSQHLMVLRRAGVLKREKRGKECYYQIAQPQFMTASDAIRETIRGVERQDIQALIPLALDPVCGMRVSSKTAGATVPFQGKNYYFCASGCAKKFERKPNAFIK